MKLRLAALMTLAGLDGGLPSSVVFAETTSAICPPASLRTRKADEKRTTGKTMATRAATKATGSSRAMTKITAGGKMKLRNPASDNSAPELLRRCGFAAAILVATGLGSISAAQPTLAADLPGPCSFEVSGSSGSEICPPQATSPQTVSTRAVPPRDAPPAPTVPESLIVPDPSPPGRDEPSPLPLDD